MGQGAKYPRSGDIIHYLVNNSFFRIKQETARTSSIFLDLLDKYSPHSRDVNDFLIVGNAMDLGAKLLTADQGFLRYPEVDIHPLPEWSLSGDDVTENSAGRNS